MRKHAYILWIGVSLNSYASFKKKVCKFVLKSDEVMNKIE